jgi:hypothetical protein
MKLITSFGLIFFVVQAYASSAHFTGLGPEWTAHLIEPHSFEAAFSNNAKAVINFREQGKTALATVYVRELPAPSEKLTDDVKAWNKVIFPNKATVKVTVFNEDVFQVNGQWRYVIHFEVETGTMLNTMIMATVSGGKLQLYSLDQQRPMFNEMLPYVKQLYKSVTFNGISE